MPLPKEEQDRLLAGRHIATLATHNADGSIHVAAVWFLFESGSLFVSTNSGSRKAKNVSARPSASIMVDVRRPGSERGATASGRAEILTGAESEEINRRIEGRFLSGEALADPAIGPVFAQMDDVTIKLTPESWIGWDMSALDAQVFGGKLGGTPGYLLPLD